MRPRPEKFDPRPYWEERGRRFGRTGEGWKAVCLRGAPEFYNRLLHRLQRSVLLRELKPAAGGSVLEFGCGVGRWADDLAGRFRRLCGIDISSTMIEGARERLSRPGTGHLHLCRFDGSRIPFQSGVFDLVFSVTVLIHIVDDSILQRAIREMCRVASPGGTIIILESFSTQSDHSLAHLRIRPEKEVGNIFRGCGWRLDSSRPVYFIFPPDKFLSSRFRRLLIRLLLPAYYYLNLLDQRLKFSRHPIQKAHFYRHE